MAQAHVSSYRFTGCRIGRKVSRIRGFLCLSVLGVCFFCLRVSAQESFRVMHYNVENFFDCRDDSLKQDEEFLPHAVRGWNWNRYHAKMNKIAKVVLAASSNQVPDLVGLCEVENAYCLDGLTRYSPLRDAAYRYVMTDSPDERGIDVALLYQPVTFRLLGMQCIRIPSFRIGRKPTRDLLHVSGRVISGDTLDVFVCHFPSRSGGTRQSEPYRLFVADVLRHTVDSLLSVRQSPYLIIMGDFNDEPSSRSISQVLGAQTPEEENDVSSFLLYNLMAGKEPGTYRYRGEWGVLDQFIVNGSMLLPSASLHTGTAEAHVLDFPFLFEEDERYGGITPFRTYKGMRYQGGYSDHLPVCLDIRIRY